MGRTLIPTQLPREFDKAHAISALAVGDQLKEHQPLGQRLRGRPVPAQPPSMDVHNPSRQRLRNVSRIQFAYPRQCIVTRCLSDRVSYVETPFKITMTVGRRPVNNRAQTSKGSKDDSTKQYLIRGGTVIDPANNVHGKCDVRLRGTRVDAVGENLSSGSTDLVVDATDRLVIPGLVDTHVASLRSVRRSPGSSNAGASWGDVCARYGGAASIADRWHQIRRGRHHRWLRVPPGPRRQRDQALIRKRKKSRAPATPRSIRAHWE